MPRQFWEEFVVDFGALAQVDHALWAGGIEHGGIEHAAAGYYLVAAGGVSAEIVPESGSVGIAGAGAGEVHGKHAPPLVAAEGGVVEVVVEDDEVAGGGFEREAAGKVARLDAEQFHGVVEIKALGADKWLGWWLPELCAGSRCRGSDRLSRRRF